MTLNGWNVKADYLKKRYDYARHVGSPQTEAWRLNLIAHLEKEPEESTTPLPQIDPSYTPTVKLDGWIWHCGGSRPTENASVRVEVRYRKFSASSGFHEQGLPSGRYFWKWDEGSDYEGNIIAYRLAKD